jgi:chemotaxis signal transduction protein
MGKRYVSFSLSSSSYCIPVDQVLQILRLENLLEIPKPPPYVEGVMNLRGEIIPVVKLAERLEIPGRDRGADPRRGADSGADPRRGADSGTDRASAAGGEMSVADAERRIPADAARSAEARAAEARRRRVIIARVGTRSYGLDVDEVREIVDIEESDITSDATVVLGARADFVLGIARREERLYVILDLVRVFGAGRDIPGALAGQG